MRFFQADLVLLHAPSVYDFRTRALMFGPVSDVVPSTPIFEMYPVGFNSLSEYLWNHGYSTRIVNLARMMLADPHLEVPELLRKLKPRAFGIDLHWLPHAQGSLEVARIVKEIHPDIPIIFGGFSSSYFHRELMAYPQVDYVLRGDSTEEPLLKLMQALQGKEELTRVPNLTWRGPEGEVRENALSYLPDTVNEYSNNYLHLFQAASRFLGLKGYIPFHDWWNYPITAIMSCRGCRENCAICGGSSASLRQIVGRKKPAFRSPEKLVADVKTVSRLTSAPMFIIGDLNQPGVEYANAVLDGLARLHFDNHLILEFFRPAPKAFFERLQKSVKNFNFEISPESHDEAVRRKSGKPYSTADMEDTIRWALAAGAQKFDVFFMIGVSGQNYQSVMDTVDYCGSLMERFPERVFPFISPLAPFIDPGSLVHQNPEAFGYQILYRTLEEHRQALLAPSWKYTLGYETKWMSRDEIAAATYEAALRLNRLKAKFKLVDEKTASAVEERILKARELMATIDEIVTSSPPEARETKLKALKEKMTALSMYTLCDEDEIKWPVIRANFHYIRIAWEIVKIWLTRDLRYL